MLDIAFLFTIFMVTLGPIKAVPGFYAQSKDMEAGERRALAFKGILFAIAISLALALIMPIIQAGWRVTTDDLRIAAGILLFLSAYQVLANDQATPPPAEQHKPEHPALSPVAIPIIITPWGAMAILMAMGLAGENTELATKVIAILLLIMAMNLVGMLFANRIIDWVGLVTFKLLGWVFAVLQVGLAVHAIAHSLQNWGVIG